MTKARALLVCAGAIVLGVAPACSKDDPSPPSPAPRDLAPLDSVVVPSAPPVASDPIAVASAPPVVSAPAVVVSAPPVPSTPAKAAPSAVAPAERACGDKPLPPCPLYAWMKANTSQAMSAEDFEGLAVALDKVVTFAPAGYANWASIAKDGANAAREQSLDGVKAACRSCHRQYKDKYKKELRDRAL